MQKYNIDDKVIYWDGQDLMLDCKICDNSNAPKYSIGQFGAINHEVNEENIFEVNSVGYENLLYKLRKRKSEINKMIIEITYRKSQQRRNKQ